MARRARTAKQLAPRIEIDYFKKPAPLRRARFALSLAGVVIAAVWLLGLAAARSHGVYSPGPVSDPHAFIGQKCELCHIAQGPGLRKARLKVSDQACLACHDGPEHQGSVPANDCGSCHAEHRGRLTQIVHVRDVDCAKCHATLDPSISRFNKDHPEFARPEESQQSDHPTESQGAPGAEFDVRHVPSHGSSGSDYVQARGRELRPAERFPGIDGAGHVQG